MGGSVEEGMEWVLARGIVRGGVSFSSFNIGIQFVPFVSYSNAIVQ
jgi:hypothetical protein